MPPVSRPSGHALHAILHSGYLHLSLISWITSNLMATALPHQTHFPGLATFSPPKAASSASCWTHLLFVLVGRNGPHILQMALHVLHLSEVDSKQCT